MRAYKHNWVDFTAVPNEIFRHNLSLKAIGLYTYIANKPDGWDFSIGGTATQLSDGKDSVRSAVRELEKAGFLARVQNRETDGGFGDSIWYIYGTPLENPMSDKPISGNPRQVMTKKVMTKREGKLSLNSDELVAELAGAIGVKPEAIKRASDKYFLFCEDKGKAPTNAGLKLWLGREQWEDADYSIKKQNELARKALMEGFMQ